MVIKKTRHGRQAYRYMEKHENLAQEARKVKGMCAAARSWRSERKEEVVLGVVNFANVSKRESD
jgi:hypothetical protein